MIRAKLGRYGFVMVKKIDFRNITPYLRTGAALSASIFPINIQTYRLL
jgi:hypothetical protein